MLGLMQEMCNEAKTGTAVGPVLGTASRSQFGHSPLHLNEGCPFWVCVRVPKMGTCFQKRAKDSAKCYENVATTAWKRFGKKFSQANQTTEPLILQAMPCGMPQPDTHGDSRITQRRSWYDGHGGTSEPSRTKVSRPRHECHIEVAFCPRVLLATSLLACLAKIIVTGSACAFRCVGDCGALETHGPAIRKVGPLGSVSAARRTRPVQHLLRTL